MSQSQQLTIEQAISQAEKTARQGNVAVARQLYCGLAAPAQPPGCRNLVVLSRSGFDSNKRRIRLNKPFTRSNTVSISG